MSPVSAQTTITGTVKDASGTALASGTIIFTLSQEGTVSDPALLVVQPVVTCTITSGVIGTCSLRGNDEISPAGTFYRLRIISTGGRTFLPERTYTITGATWDIGTATPLASDTIAAQAYQIVQDEGANLTQRQKLNFTGVGVACTDDSANARTTCDLAAASGGYNEIQEEGVPLTARAKINFIGAQVTAADDVANGRTNITITSSGGGATHQIDGVDLTTQDPINFLDTSEFDWTNPAAGDLSLALKAASVADSKLTSNYSGVGSCTNQFVRGVNDDAAPTCESIADADLPSTNALDSELHAQSHVLATTAGLGADHTTSGLTAGQVLRATGASTAAFGSLQAGDLPVHDVACASNPCVDDAEIVAAIARDSELHAQVHGAADHTGDVIPAANQNFGAFYSDFGEIAAPANPAAGVVRVYAKTGTGELCSRDSAGSENCMSSGSGGSNHNLLSATHSDTTAAAVVRGDLMVGQTATPVWQRLAIGGANTFLGSDGTDPTWTGLVLAGAQFVNQGSTTQVLHGNAVGNPTWAAVSLTADVSGVLPGANGGTNNAFMDFTGPATSLKTFALPNASSTILTSNAAVTSAQGGTGANNTATTGRYLRGDGSNFVTSSVAAAGAGSCTNQVVTATVDNAAPTCSNVSSAMISDGVVASSDLATANKTFVQPVVLFDSTGLLDADDIPSVWRAPAAITIIEVWCETDAGTPSVNLQRDDGTPADILSSNLTCTTGGATGSIAAAEDNVAATERIDFVMVSASTAKRISLMIKYTVD